MRTTLLFFIAALSAGRAEAQVRLNVPLHGQETSSWCYAATTQMIGEYFNSTIKQCTIASWDNDGRDCCPDSHGNIDPNCVNGGDTYDTLTYWGFPGNDIDGALSYSGIQTEIDAHRPVQTSIAWNSNNNHHSIIVDGYWTKSDGSHHVHILNPLPVGSGDEEWATYGVYVNGGTEDSGTSLGGHVITTTDTQLRWGPVCSYDFANLDSSLYQQCWDQRVHHGQWPASLSSGDGKMAGNWRGTGSRPVSWNKSLSSLEDRVGTLSDTLRPDQITVNSESPALFNCIWTPETHLWTTHFASSSSALVADDDTLFNEGYIMVDLYGYNSTGSPQFSATWVKESGGYLWEPSVSISTLKTDDTTNRHAGWMMTRVSTFTDANGNMRATALWRPSTVSAYQVFFNQTSSAFQSNYDTYTSQGYTLAYTSMFGSDNINAIYTK